MKRNKGVSVRLSEQEREHLDFIAKALNETPSEVMRGILAAQPHQVMKLVTKDTHSIKWQEPPKSSGTSMIVQHWKVPA